jgi:hypothetical protein
MNPTRFWQKLATTTVVAVTLAISTACVTGGRLYVQVGPPRPLVEAAVVSPGPGYVWTPGYHRWDGGGYVWVPGAWVRAPRPRAVWVPGRWVRDRRHGWYYVEGRWR